ncbi:hypothetical protein KHQ32_03005 [Weissella tructae]|nr:hypothetical protein KHQ32_03005 [Weissella tructae]
MPILDVQTQYFGDELYIYIESDEETCWKISFLSCYKVDYQTDVNWRSAFFESKGTWEPFHEVKNMRGGQLGYFGQDITVSHNDEVKGLMNVSLDLSIMYMNIVCRDIVVEKVNMSKLDFFWQHDVKK